MSRILTVSLFTLALCGAFLVPNMPVAGAGDYIPIGSGTWCVVLTDGDDTFIAQTAYKADLEAFHGGTASYSTLGDAISNAPDATSTNVFVMYGCYAEAGAQWDLIDKGYSVQSDVTSSFPGASLDSHYEK